MVYGDFSNQAAKKAKEDLVRRNIYIMPVLAFTVSQNLLSFPDYISMEKKILLD